MRTHPATASLPVVMLSSTSEKAELDRCYEAGANSVVRNNSTYGVLKMTLHAGSYDWAFLSDGKSGTFTDSGSASCV